MSLQSDRKGVEINDLISVIEDDSCFIHSLDILQFLKCVLRMLCACVILSPLSLYDGVKLLETLAERIHLTTSSFINIRYNENECNQECVCVCVFECEHMRHKRRTLRMTREDKV